MLESLGVEPIADWVLHHHERWDGTGYPDKLAAEAIPLGARIIFVADAFDAMTFRAVYAVGQPRGALAELERCAGSQFDPSVVCVFRTRSTPEIAATRAIASEPRPLGWVIAGAALHRNDECVIQPSQGACGAFIGKRSFCEPGRHSSRGNRVAGGFWATSAAASSGADE